MNTPTVHLICNAHLDPVWQWQWEEGCGEALSTFRTAVRILGEHPGLVFNHNEAVLYRWVQEHDPQLFDEIRRCVREGRWCISGGWFLQPDVNMSGTESIIRQIAEGRRFFRQWFGAEPKVAYNFDSFGHSGGLPQVLVQAGYEMYIHLRPQAPELELPADLYRWRGVDGSEIAALRIAVGLYHTERDNIAARLRVGTDLALKLGRDVPVFWGIGNHGGGPTRDDLLVIDRFIRDEPRVRIAHSTPERFLEAVRTAIPSAPVVEGDLQRVFTGCYTSLSRVKRKAVQSLGVLTQTECAATSAWWCAGGEYPAEEIADAWRAHLFNDFHDILPGTCTEPAERDALELYGRSADTSRRVRMRAVSVFSRGTPRDSYVPLTVFNANPSCTVVPLEPECMLDLRPKWSGEWHLELFDDEGQALVCQEEQPESLLPFNGWRRKVSFLASLPGVGLRRYELKIKQGPPARTATRPSIAYTLSDTTGLVDNLRTPDGTQCLRGNLLEMLVVHDDGDSWGTDRWSYRDLVGRFAPEPGSVRVIESGPVRTITESAFQYARSRCVLQTIAYSGWPVLEFRLRLMWHERGVRLKLAVPTAFPVAGVFCEVPGGAIARPADGGEHVHGRWLVVEGPGAALGVAHSGLHGIDCLAGEVRLSVLRGAAYCHEQGFRLDTHGPERKFMDQGLHEIRLLVATGDPFTVRSITPGLADLIAAPPAVYAHLPFGGPAGPVELLSTHPANIRLLACKRSDDGASMIVRLQEAAGIGTAGRIVLPGARTEHRIDFKPFEIRTLRIDPSGSCGAADLIRESLR